MVERAWPWVHFGDLYAVPSRNGVSVPKGDRDRGTKMINMGELFRYDRIGDPPMARVPLSAGELERALVAEGDLLFARRSLKLSGAGRCALVDKAPESRTFESSIIRTRLDLTRSDPVFYFYFFRSAVGTAAMDTIVEQVAVAGIRSSDLATLPVPSPSLEEQRRVAETLGNLDAKIDSNICSADIAERVLGLLSALDPDPPVVPLGAVVTVDREAVNPQTLDVSVDHYSIPAFDSGRWPGRCDPSMVKSNKLLVRAPSILLSRLNPGTPRLWHAVPDADTPALASTEFLVMRPDDGLGIGDVWLACSDPLFIEVMARRATGTSGSHQRIRPADALSLEVIDPRLLPDGIRREAADLLELVHRRRSESRHLAALRDALLPELLSGRLRVPEAEELVSDVT